MKFLIQPFYNKKKEVPLVKKQLEYAKTEAKEGGFVFVPMADNFEEPRIRSRGSIVVTQICLLLVGILTVGIAFMGAMHLYKQSHAFHGGRYRGMCRIPYPRNTDAKLAMITGDFRGGDDRNAKDDALDSQVRFNRVLEKLVGRNSVELDFELDIETGLYETLRLPEISYGHYLHDFKVNKTAIIDPRMDRCFVMPLDRNEIEPPINLIDTLNKMKDGTYKLDVEEIRKDTRVVLPPIGNLKDYGTFIYENCVDKTTYLLEEATGTRFIRSTAGKTFDEQFIEYAGKRMIRYNIINLKEI